MWSPSRQPRQRFACGPKNELGDLAQVLDGSGEAKFVTSAATTAEQAAARDLLAPVYGWFAEEFDTAALKAAKALLDELA